MQGVAPENVLRTVLHFEVPCHLMPTVLWDTTLATASNLKNPTVLLLIYSFAALLPMEATLAGILR